MISCAVIAFSFAAILAGVAKIIAQLFVIIACNALQILHAIIAGFEVCWKVFVRQKCCSQ